MLLGVACSQPRKENQVSLKDQVMAVHDEVMPKMGDLRSTQKQLLAKADSAAADSVVSAQYTELADRIDQANESMMVWMRNFDPNFTGTEEEQKAYLEGKLKEVEEVKADMLQALEEGRKAL